MLLPVLALVTGIAVLGVINLSLAATLLTSPLQVTSIA
ncbi:hypothetical protein ABIE45_006222 [Methylobacterium sp. OAE515]